MCISESRPESISCFPNYSEFGHYGYCVIHGANYTFYITNTYLNWILRFDWLYHYSGSSTSTIIYYGYQTLTLKAKWAGTARLALSLHVKHLKLPFQPPFYQLHISQILHVVYNSQGIAMLELTYVLWILSISMHTSYRVS